MKEGPSSSVIRSRSQATASCCGQMPWWLRNEQTRALVQPLPRPVGLPARFEKPRDLLVGHQARQLADQRQGIFGHRPAMLAGPIHLQIQRGVVPTLPMQDHLDEAAFDAHNDLVQCHAQDPVAGRCCRSRMRPGELEIGIQTIRGIGTRSIRRF